MTSENPEVENLSFVHSRVEQLDALELDDEVLHVLKNQISTALKFLPLSLQGKWEPEVRAALELVVLHLSVNGNGATFGQQLLSLKFLSSQRRAALLASLIPICLKYLRARSQDAFSKVSNNQRRKDQINSFIHGLETASFVGSLINLVIFLHNGLFPNILHRILNLRMVHATVPPRLRQVGYTLMTRELVWHGFIELLVFVLPLINYHVIKHKIVELVTFGSPSKTDSPSGKNIVLNLQTRCALCLRRPILPHHIDCGHTFCFYCLQANVLADSNFPCPTCGHKAQGLTSVKKVYVAVASSPSPFVLQ